MAVAASSAEITRPILLWHLSRGTYPAGPVNGAATGVRDGHDSQGEGKVDSAGVAINPREVDYPRLLPVAA